VELEELFQSCNYFNAISAMTAIIEIIFSGNILLFFVGLANIALINFVKKYCS